MLSEKIPVSCSTRHQTDNRSGGCHAYILAMENEHIISGLLRKRADIAGEIAVLHDKLRAQQTDLAAVESTLKLFQPDIDFSGARVSRKPRAQWEAVRPPRCARGSSLRDRAGQGCS